MAVRKQEGESVSMGIYLRKTCFLLFVFASRIVRGSLSGMFFVQLAGSRSMASARNGLYMCPAPPITAGTVDERALAHGH